MGFTLILLSSSQLNGCELGISSFECVRMHVLCGIKHCIINVIPSLSFAIIIIFATVICSNEPN